MLGCPTSLNPAVNKTIVLLVKSVNLPAVTGSHGVQSEEQAKSYLDASQLFNLFYVLLTERQNHVPACYD